MLLECVILSIKMAQSACPLIALVLRKSEAHFGHKIQWLTQENA